MDFPDDGVRGAAELFQVLSSPVRLAILRRLTEEPQAVQQLVDALDVAQPLVSQHLRVLRMAGLVRVEASGRERRYAITDQHVSHIVLDAITHAEEDHDDDTRQR